MGLIIKGQNKRDCIYETIPLIKGGKHINERKCESNQIVYNLVYKKQIVPIGGAQ